MDELTGPASGQNSYLSIGGVSLTATPDGLFFDFSGAGVVRFMNAFVAGPDSSYWCLDNVLQFCSASSGETIVSKGTFVGFTSRTGVQMVAEVAAIRYRSPPPWVSSGSVSPALVQCGAGNQRRKTRTASRQRPRPWCRGFHFCEQACFDAFVAAMSVFGR